MGNTRDIKRRIGSVTSTRQITKAMKMVAASKLRHSQNRIINARPYANFVDMMLRTLKLKNKSGIHPLLNEEIQKDNELLIIVTADRGLCGGFNSNIVRTAKQYIEKKNDIDVICLGKKGIEGIRKTKANLVQVYEDLFNEMDFSISSKIGTDLIERFLKGEYGKIKVLYNEFKSAIQQDIVFRQLLPIVPLESEMVSQTDFIYEPDEDTLIEELCKKAIDVDLWRVMLESSAAEQAARMTAMDSATDNATELIDKLTLQYNRERQSAITTEIVEIASGAEAINN